MAIKTRIKHKSFIVLKLAYGYKRMRPTKNETGENCTSF